MIYKDWNERVKRGIKEKKEAKKRWEISSQGDR